MDAISEYIFQRKPIPNTMTVTDEMRTTLNKYGYTLAQWWVIRMMSDPPSYLRHDPTLRDKVGNTIFMLWIECLHTEPPTWMQHDSSLKNYNGDTAEIVWYKFMIPLPPDYLHYEEESEIIDIDPDASYSTAEDLSFEKQLDILINNEKKINARVLYNMYLNWCMKYHITNRANELAVHKYLTSKYRKVIKNGNAIYFI